MRSRSVDLYIKWPLEPKDQGHTSFNTTLLGQLPKGCTLVYWALTLERLFIVRAMRGLLCFWRSYLKIVGSKCRGAVAIAKNAYDCEKSLL